MSAAPPPDWDPVMLDTYLAGVEEPELDDQLKLELRRTVMDHDLCVDVDFRPALWSHR